MPAASRSYSSLVHGSSLIVLTLQVGGYSRPSPPWLLGRPKQQQCALIEGQQMAREAAACRALGVVPRSDAAVRACVRGGVQVEGPRRGFSRVGRRRTDGRGRTDGRSPEHRPTYLSGAPV